jgi:hypothetical protein
MPYPDLSEHIAAEAEARQGERNPAWEEIGEAEAWFLLARQVEHERWHPGEKHERRESA